MNGLVDVTRAVSHGRTCRMSWVEIALLAVGLSMDAFAVSVGKGLAMRRLNLGSGVRASARVRLLPGVHALDRLVGRLALRRTDHRIRPLDRLRSVGAIGGKMLWRPCGATRTVPRRRRTPACRCANCSSLRWKRHVHRRLGGGRRLLSDLKHLAHGGDDRGDHRCVAVRGCRWATGSGQPSSGLPSSLAG